MNALNSKAVVTIIGLALLAGTAPAWAQSPTNPHHQPPAASAAAPGTMQGGAHEGSAMPMMGMCQQMMNGPMTAMGGDAGHMLEMRGEMMKAMGDIMLKHARRMQGKSPVPK